MARNDEGEFELVLGNRQLLSVFFILVVLMGVFFAMGYIVGRNNPSKDAVETAARREQPIDANDPAKSRPIVVEGDTNKPSPAKETPDADPPKPVEEAKAEPPKPVETKPAIMPKPEPTKAEEKKKPEEKKKTEEKKKPEPVKAEKPKPAEAPAGAPAAGQTFLQVVATDKATCEAIAETLRKKSFSAMVTPGPSEKIFRVVVGPLKDSATTSKTKIDLEAIGFKGAYVRKY